MTVRRIRGLPALGPILLASLKEKRQLVIEGYTRAMELGADYVADRVPVASSELRDSIYGDRKGIHADAPQAGPVERGSRPHMPPVDAIEAWVKLRGLQANLPADARRRLPGVNTRQMASVVGSMLKEHVSNGASPVDSPRRVAWAIAMKIKREGTKPHWYMRGSLPGIMKILDREVKKALRKR